MKTVLKVGMGTLAFAAVLILPSVSLHAQDLASTAVAAEAAAVLSAVPAQPSPPANNSQATVPAGPLPGEASSAEIKMGPSGGGGALSLNPEGSDKAEDNLLLEGNTDSQQIPGSVRNVLKDLRTSTEGLTVQDLNKAREASSRLDALIDIEKRLNDLATLRQERLEKAGAALGAAIPLSALSPSAGGVVCPSKPTPPPPPPPPSFNPQVEMVVGARGRYTAVIRVLEDKTVRVHEGDMLPNDRRVLSITPRAVVISKADGGSETLLLTGASVLIAGKH